MIMDYNLAFQVLGIIAGVISTVGIMAWRLNSQFNANREYFSMKMEAVVEKILNKLEYHERHDDKRFAEIRDDIWEVRLRQVAVNSRKSFDQKETNRRREDKERETEAG